MVRDVAMQRMSAIFNEWARRYAENPASFAEILDDAGLPVQDYGERTAVYFTHIADEMDAAGQLPRPPLLEDRDG